KPPQASVAAISRGCQISPPRPSAGGRPQREIALTIKQTIVHGFGGRAMTSTERALGRDERVAIATSHWGPRFVAQGVDLSDFQRTVERITRWSDWCREWGATAREYEIAAETAAADERRLTAAEEWRRTDHGLIDGRVVF